MQNPGPSPESNRRHHLLALTAIGAALLATAGCKSAESGALARPEIAVLLPVEYNTPDGMALDANGNIILSCPNFNDDSHPAKILRIDADDRIREVFTLPVHPVTGKVGPLGVAVGDDGHLYVADNQSDFIGGAESRLLRVVMKDGKAVGCEVLVAGFVQSNAVSVHEGCVYVTETKLRPDAVPLVSGVYRFPLEELSGNAPLRLQPDGADPHLIATVATHNPDWRVGANGMGFGADGNLYFCNFGDAQIIRLILDDAGAVTSQTVFAEGQGMLSTDGIKFDPMTGDIYVADFVGNAVHQVDGNTGRVKTLARNELTDGAGGSLDRPSEVCLRGNRLYISNIDLPYGGNEYDEPHTISVIELSR